MTRGNSVESGTPTARPFLINDGATAERVRDSAVLSNTYTVDLLIPQARIEPPTIERYPRRQRVVGSHTARVVLTETPASVENIKHASPE